MEQHLNMDRSLSPSDDVTNTNNGVPSSSTEEGAETGHSSNSSFSLAQQETKAVKRSKLVVYAIIALAAASLGCVTYIFVANSEHDTFQSEFYDHAIEIIDLVHLEMQTILSLTAEMAVTISVFAEVLNATWPYVTIPHFDLMGEKFNTVCRSFSLSLVPMVRQDKLESWEAYAYQNQVWLDERALLSSDALRNHTNHASPQSIPTSVHQYINFAQSDLVEGNVSHSHSAEHAIVWQQSPAPVDDPSVINLDLLSHPVFRDTYYSMLDHDRPMLSRVTDLSFLYKDVDANDTVGDPESFILSPVRSNVYDDDTTWNSTPAALLVVILPWGSYFNNLISQAIGGVVIVVNSTCGDVFTYQLEGISVSFVGLGDLHDPKFSDLRLQAAMERFHTVNDQHSHEYEACEYRLTLYPTAAFEAEHTTKNPALYAAVVVLVFVWTAAVFFVYDLFVERRQRKVMMTAKRTNAVVASLFPANVRDRILMEAEAHADEAIGKNKQKHIAPKTYLKDFLHEEHGHECAVFKTKPIADLFPMVTVMFADIAGFTAWSSVREPSEVFTLLETVYHAFDEIAKRRRIFKVETVGDCYVAVCGLPDPRKDHAVAMARFARDCLHTMNVLTKQLDAELGPDTSDLSLRIGLHSGPVTAGVLRGEKSRFQLFGDTVNTAARVESTGQANRIHVSDETAKILIESGKPSWVTSRADEVHAKGKGNMHTYWLELKPSSSASTKSGLTSTDETSSNHADETILADGNQPTWQQQIQPFAEDKNRRFIEWNTDILCRKLRKIIARRQVTQTSSLSWDLQQENANKGWLLSKPVGTVLEEVKEIIELPMYNAAAARDELDPNMIELDSKVAEQVRDYVTMISGIYRDNPFHNFEHASHVTMSVVKLLKRIVAPTDEVLKEGQESKIDDIAAMLHDHSYGITSDPLTHFACVFAALIHDVDHTGVPNAQLIKEKSPLAVVYKNQSIAEQNSVDVAWNLLMDSCFDAFRATLCPTGAELKRFRQLVVNCVMATDIVDKELKELRNKRWERAFEEDHSRDKPTSLACRLTFNRKATIVLEHLIQASDVAHTMQHWQIYRKWNERFFHETYHAYKQGRCEQDPCDSWYTGELGFFDFYIIPLAKKLKECGVFGVSSDEYLNYAEKNRSEWEHRGQAIVEAMKEKYEKMYREMQHQQEKQENSKGLETTVEVAPAPESARDSPLPIEQISNSPRAATRNFLTVSASSNPQTRRQEPVERRFR